MNTDTQGPLITARSFFREMRSYGYTPKQIIWIINELLELVTSFVREEKRTNVLADATVDAGRHPPDVR